MFIEFRNLRNLIMSGLLFSCPFFVSAQEDPLAALDSGTAPQKEYVKASFKGTRVINNHSLENLAEGVLDFRIMHRFGPLNTGAYEAFGLDRANTRLQLDYGVKDWLMVGIGRSGNPKAASAYAKWKFIRQSEGGNHPMPFSALLLTSIDCSLAHFSDPNRKNYFSSKLSYVNQLIIGKKVNDNFSFEVVPTFIHRNLVAKYTDHNDQWAAGAAVRQKLTKRLSLNAEYFYLITKDDPTLTNPLSIGFDIETGGHVFQLHFTNSLGLSEKSFISETNEHWIKGKTGKEILNNFGVHFGFNISRVFTLYRPGFTPAMQPGM